MTSRVYKGMSGSKVPILTKEEWECVRVCVSNAPIPYDITKKKIPISILDKIGEPTRIEHEGETKVTCDLNQYE